MVNIWTGFVTADSGWVIVTLRNVQNLNSPIKKKTGDGKTRILKLKTSQKKFACSHVEFYRRFNIEIYHKSAMETLVFCICSTQDF